MEVTVSELKDLINSFGVDVKRCKDKPSITIPVSARENGKLYKPFSISANNDTIPAYEIIDHLGVYDLGKAMLWVVKK